MIEKRVNLSERLKAVAALITPGGVVADIGCDHAYTSIYLIQQGLARKVIAMDVNRGPLERAKENIRQYGVEEQIELRLSDGVKALHAGEADSLLISGMGGALMQRILLADQKLLQEVNEFVLQPQSELREFRLFLQQHNMQIVKEDMVKEEGKFYPMLLVKKGEAKEMTEVALRYGEKLLAQRHRVLEEYLYRERKQLEQIKQKLQEQHSEKSRERLVVVHEDITYCEEAIAYYDSGTGGK